MAPSCAKAVKALSSTMGELRSTEGAGEAGRLGVGSCTGGEGDGSRRIHSLGAGDSTCVGGMSEASMEK